MLYSSSLSSHFRISKTTKRASPKFRIILLKATWKHSINTYAGGNFIPMHFE